ncbi:inositol monophosphatase family protein [Cupriavidus basilensis]|uniref:Inositol-1-monophosphatase n=1 Tax=Cupriavidus basilensis TaxID=68895 RepID=A0A0C4YSY9_9BURK|nr:inositol monophosphatase family protein [Cupriavidus basilensis]AJG25049.1 Inositol-1-monophosphatase [Cupriavidus basilensis]
MNADTKTNVNVNTQLLSERLSQPVAAVLDSLSALLAQQGRLLRTQQPRSAPADFQALRAAFEQHSGAVGSTLKRALLERWPQIPFSDKELESGEQQAPEHADAYWVCDPIDGALHYLSGMPGWTIALCLVVEGVPALALVHDPATGRTYRAVAGQGADCDGAPLRANARGELASALITTAHPNWPGQVRNDTAAFLDRFGRLLPQVFGQRVYGPTSLLLALVAGGALDGYWECGQDYYDWLPGVLLVTEAGGVVTALDGKPFTWGCQGIVAAGPAMHAGLRSALARQG